MKVYLVGICDCESNSVEFVCSTYELALNKFHELRLDLIKKLEEYIKEDYIFENIFHNSTGMKVTITNDMYSKMANNLK